MSLAYFLLNHGASVEKRNLYTPDLHTKNPIETVMKGGNRSDVETTQKRTGIGIEFTLPSLLFNSVKNPIEKAWWEYKFHFIPEAHISHDGNITHYIAMEYSLGSIYSNEYYGYKRYLRTVIPANDFYACSTKALRAFAEAKVKALQVNALPEEYPEGVFPLIDTLHTKYPLFLEKRGNGSVVNLAPMLPLSNFDEDNNGHTNACRYLSFALCLMDCDVNFSSYENSLHVYRTGNKENYCSIPVNKQSLFSDIFYQVVEWCYISMEVESSSERFILSNMRSNTSEYSNTSLILDRPYVGGVLTRLHGKLSHEDITVLDLATYPYLLTDVNAPSLQNTVFEVQYALSAGAVRVLAEGNQFASVCQQVAYDANTVFGMDMNLVLEMAK